MNKFYPYGIPYQPTIPQMPQQNTQQLPQQTVIQVDGRASVEAIKMAPNSSVLLMDKSAPIVWLCTSDGLGNVTSTAYDITEHQDTPPVDVTSLEERVKILEEKINAKSYDRSSKPKQYKANN